MLRQRRCGSHSMQALWEWLRDEHNRAIVGMLGGVIAA